MKTRIVEILVGLFLVLGIVALLVLALQVSGLTNFFEGKTGYDIRAEFSNIGGLKAKAKVVVAGVGVGRITEIHLNPKTFEASVTLRIDDKFRELPLDSKASILTSGLLGDNYIELTPGFEEDYLEDGSVIPVENTDSALLLEKLISKFMTQKAGE